MSIQINNVIRNESAQTMTKQLKPDTVTDVISHAGKKKQFLINNKI